MCGLAAAVAADGRALCHRPVEDMYKMCVVRDMPPRLHWQSSYCLSLKRSSPGHRQIEARVAEE